MMRFTRIYLLYVVVFAWMNYPSNALAAACSFPLTQTAVQSCDGLFVSLGQIGTVNNSGIINAGSGPGISVTPVWNYGTITNFLNTSTGQVVGGASSPNGFVNASSGVVNTFTNDGFLSANSYTLGNGGLIDVLINGSSGVIAGDSVPFINGGSGTINSISNSGTIAGSSGHGGIYNYGNIGSIVNEPTGITRSIINWYSDGCFCNINEITNRGEINGSILNGYVIGQITNTGIVQGITNEGNITTINNNVAGSVQGISNSGTIITINNSGMINSGISNSGTINSITNLAAGTIENTIQISGLGNIGTITNDGVINSAGADGIQNNGIIASINNAGTISGSGYSINNLGKITFGITNGGTISSLYNKQGSWNGGALSYTGAVPGSYYTLISSVTNYGQIAFVNPTGTMNFNIATGSTVQKGTYTNIMTGISSSNISNKSGVFDGLSWKLTQNDTGGWDLIFGYLGVSIKNTTASLYSNQQSINLFLHQRYAVMAVVLNYDCANFDKYGVCISFQSRATGFGNQSTGAGVMTASHKITDKIHVGAFLDYQVNQVAPGGPSIGPGGVQSGFNNATFGGFASYYANPNKIGLQARIAGAYNPGKVTITRPFLENTEAGTGTAGLDGSGVYGEIGWGLGLAKSVIATPFVGIRGIDITRKGYSESHNAAVQYPVSYNSYFERVLTSIAGGQVKAAITDRLNFQAGVWAELDVRRSANSYSGWSTIPGLETFSLAHGGTTNRLRPAGYAGLSYEVSKNQRITANTVVREQAYSDRTNVTSLVGYQFSF